MIDRKCECCQELFPVNKYHVHDQEYCGAPACRKASHMAANKKWRAKQTVAHPLLESRRKRKARQHERFKLTVEVNRWRKQLVQQQMLLLGMLNLLSGAKSASGDLANTISNCLDAGQELLRGGILFPGFGFSLG